MMPLRSRRDYGEEEEWTSVKSMAEICPECAEKMSRCGISRVKTTMIRQASLEGSVVGRYVAWDKLPKGWTEESAKKFWANLTSGSPKHKVKGCIKKMTGKVENPEGFCAGLADMVVPEWRSEKKAEEQPWADRLIRHASLRDEI